MFRSTSVFRPLYIIFSVGVPNSSAYLPNRLKFSKSVGKSNLPWYDIFLLCTPCFQLYLNTFQLSAYALPIESIVAAATACCALAAGPPNIAPAYIIKGLSTVIKLVPTTALIGVLGELSIEL